jgi:hypothetical protein
MYRNQHWRKYMSDLWKNDHRDARLQYAHYVCREWNLRHPAGSRVKELEIYFMLERTLPNYQVSEPRKVLLVRTSCGIAF